MLAREIDVQKMRLYEASLGNTVAPPSQTNQSRGAAVESKAVPPPAAVETPAPVPNHIGQLLKMKTEIGADALTAAKVSRWIICRNDSDDGSRQCSCLCRPENNRWFIRPFLPFAAWQGNKE